jgi:polyhydroxyalkanoate synthesis regulator phasin
MYRKLVFSVVSILGLMTLVVSAQQPPGEPQPSQIMPIQQGSYPTNPPLPPLTNYYPARVDGGSRSKENELIRTSQDLVKKLAKAEGESRDKIKAKLSETLDQQFDIRQKRHEDELKALEDQVKKLRDMVQKRKDNRREIIGKRFEQLVRDAEGLGW